THRERSNLRRCFLVIRERGKLFTSVPTRPVFSESIISLWRQQHSRGTLLPQRPLVMPRLIAEKLSAEKEFSFFPRPRPPGSWLQAKGQCHPQVIALSLGNLCEILVRPLLSLQPPRDQQ